MVDRYLMSVFYVFPVMIRIPISLNMLSGRCDGFYVFARDEMKENTSKSYEKIEAAVCGITLLYVFSTIGTIYCLIMGSYLTLF